MDQDADDKQLNKSDKNVQHLKSVQSFYLDHRNTLQTPSPSQIINHKTRSHWRRKYIGGETNILRGKWWH